MKNAAIQSSSFLCKTLKLGSLKSCLAIGALALLSACAPKTAPVEEPQETVSQAQLMAYCPQITLRDGTSFYNSYAAGGQGDAQQVVYQASIAEVTRNCNTVGNQLHLTVAAAGRIVPGPKFRSTNVTMPIRVVVVQGGSVVYSKLHRYAVRIQRANEATQFIFNDDQINIPTPTARNVRIFIGFDESVTR